MKNKSLLDLKNLTREEIEHLFSLAEQLKKKSRPAEFNGDTIGLCFFEPSTRTRLSFQTAAFRVGLGPLVFGGAQGTSLEKGETVEDSILNIAAMNPQFLVIRCGDEVNLEEMDQHINMPIINAGWGKKGHPTQALLDALTIYEHFETFHSVKVLFVGDIKHSRVVSSHFELLDKLGAQIAVCGPEEFWGTAVQLNHVKKFNALEEALNWADAVVALRFQFERHEKESPKFSKENYRKQYGINSSRLHQFFSKKGILMHPGPINHGIELETEILSDPRSRVLQQVTNGVYIREAILRWLMDES